MVTKTDDVLVKANISETAKAKVTKPKRASKSTRTHARRVKSEARKTAGTTTTHS
jgi:hypothetical protein